MSVSNIMALVSGVSSPASGVSLSVSDILAPVFGKPDTPRSGQDDAACAPAGQCHGSPSGEAPAAGTAARREDRAACEAEFQRFWQRYPRKQGYGAALKQWRLLAPDAALKMRMGEALTRAVLCEQWRRDGGRYIPAPATWLRERRWEDAPGPDAPGANDKARSPQEEEAYYEELRRMYYEAPGKAADGAQQP